MMSLAISEPLWVYHQFFVQHWILLSLLGSLAFFMPPVLLTLKLNQFFEYRADRYIARYGDPAVQIAYWWQRNETHSGWATHPSDRQRARALAHITGLALPPDDALQ